MTQRSNNFYIDIAREKGERRGQIMIGKVFLIGGGPGDPDLLTVKATRLLNTADVVLHDDLIGRTILDLVPEGALIENVGKRAGGKHHSQQLINNKMIYHAALGRRVVRLKGGDPMLFGRAGEEVEALRAAGIDFEVVPGVTAALAASAEGRFPLTDRALASSVLFVSGHSCAGSDGVNWNAAIATGATLVIYMPGDHTSLMMTLLREGADPALPCALISHVSLPSQMIKNCSLMELASMPPKNKPSLLVIGKVLEHGRADAALSFIPEIACANSFVESNRVRVEAE